MNSDIVQEKSKDKLKDLISQHVVKGCGGDILDMAEVAIGNPDVYKSFRRKVLRILNDQVRSLHLELDKKYTVDFDSNMDSIITTNSHK